MATRVHPNSKKNTCLLSILIIKSATGHCLLLPQDRFFCKSCIKGWCLTPLFFALAQLTVLRSALKDLLSQPDKMNLKKSWEKLRGTNMVPLPQWYLSLVSLHTFFLWFAWYPNISTFHWCHGIILPSFSYNNALLIVSLKTSLKWKEELKTLNRII